MIVKDIAIEPQAILETEIGSESRQSWLDNNTLAFLVSLVFHTTLILLLALVHIAANADRVLLVLDAAPSVPEQVVTITEEVAPAEEPHMDVGASSDGDSGLALSMAPVLAELSALPAPAFDKSIPDTPYDLNSQLNRPIGLVRSDTVVKGMTGVGATGTDGAVDRITAEILRAMEERPTLVVWLFDQSGSLQRRRTEVRDRFDRIYRELGLIQRSKEEMEGRKWSEEPLLTSIIAFGSKVSLLTKTPTADIATIRSAIDSISTDPTGVERVFAAIAEGLGKYKSYRSSTSGRGPERNVLFIAVTDERGDDADGMDQTIKECRKFAIPVYVVGVPAPFGREFTYVKYVDPDPKFDQTPQWAQVDQGPESLFPERVKLGYKDNYFDEPVLDSGFGPYALSRLCYETGGIYFTVHPNRQFGRRVTRQQIDPFASDLEYFFDPEIMTRYRPDYVSVEEYSKKVKESPLRQALVAAARMSAVDSLINPTLRFVRRDEAALANALTAAQLQAARLEPQLLEFARVLQAGAEHLDKEVSPRWIAGFELAYGTVLAHKVRAEGYNAMLAKAKRGMAFEKSTNNTWILRPDSEISVGSRTEKEGQMAMELLKAVSEKHAGTPWGMLATRELRNPLGWKWVEDHTDLSPPARGTPRANNNNSIPRAAQDEQARMLAPPTPKRPIPKL